MLWSLSTRKPFTNFIKSSNSGLAIAEESIFREQLVHADSVLADRKSRHGLLKYPGRSLVGLHIYLYARPDLVPSLPERSTVKWSRPCPLNVWCFGRLERGSNSCVTNDLSFHRSTESFLLKRTRKNRKHWILWSIPAFLPTGHFLFVVEVVLPGA